jgi:hypothetical protein
MDHFFYRSREDLARKAAQWGMLEHLRSYKLTDAASSPKLWPSTPTPSSGPASPTIAPG